MACLPQSNKWRGREKIFLLSAAIVLFAVIISIFLNGGFKVCEETAIRNEAGNLLFAGTREGRQALVGSIWWAPFPSMFVFVLKHIPLVKEGHIPLFLLSAFSFVAAVALAELYLRRGGWGKMWRFMLVLPLIFNGCLAEAFLCGSFGVMSACAVIVFVDSMVKWIKDFRLRYLVYIAISSACLCMLQFELGLWAFAGMLIISADLVHRMLLPGQKQAVIIILFVPFLYVAFLWILLNWLIMGNPFYFAQTIKLIFPLHGIVMWGKELRLILYYGIPVVILLLCGIAKNEKHYFYLGAMTIFLCTEALFFYANKMEFVAEKMFPSIILLSVLCCGSIANFTGSSAVKYRHGLIVLFFTIIAAATRYEMSGGYIFAEKVPPAEAIRTYVKNTAKHAKVFVVGYKGLALIPVGKTGKEFIHVFDFDVRNVAREYPGQTLYLLVHEPTGIAKFDSLYVKYPDLYSCGISGVIYDSQWGKWRLFKIVGAMPPFRL